MKKVLIGAGIVVVLLTISGYLGLSASGPALPPDIADGRRFAERVLLGSLATWDYDAFRGRMVTFRLNKRALPKVQSVFESSAEKYGSLVAYAETTSDFKDEVILPFFETRVRGSVTYAADFTNGSLVITLGVEKYNGAWGVRDINLAPPQ